MSTVSPQLVLGICILGACILIVIGYALSRLLRPKVLNEHEESDEMTNPFHEMSREQKEYMLGVRRRTTDALWDRLRFELKKDKEMHGALTGTGGGGGGGGGSIVVREQVSSHFSPPSNFSVHESSD